MTDELSKEEKAAIHEAWRVRTPEDRINLAWKMLDSRAHRMKRLVELRAPASVIAREVRLLHRAVMILDSGAVGEIMAEEAEQYALRATGLCRMCGKIPATRKGEMPDFCEKCEAEVVMEGADAVLDDISHACEDCTPDDEKEEDDGSDG